jgi:hypothetical protein
MARHWGGPLKVKVATMDLAYIYATFKALETVTEKVTFLKELETLSLPYEINFSGLIAAWERIEA